MKFKANMALGIVVLLISSALLVIVPVNVQAEYTGDVTIHADGSVTPSDAPIDVRGVNYILTDDIVGKIIILRSRMHLDGDGHIIQGSGSGFGISINGLSKVTVKDCLVDGFTVNIRLDDSTKCTIKDNIVTNSGMAAIALWYGSNENTVKSNYLEGNAYGIKLLEGSSKNTVKDNIVLNTGNEAIDSFKCSANVIKNNVVTTCGWAGSGGSDYDWGISIRISPDCIVKGNRVTDSKEQGILVANSDGILISDNEVIKTGTHGIFLYNSDYSTIRENVVEDIPKSGIIVRYSQYVEIKGNEVMRSSEDGILLDNSNNNIIKGNVLYDNQYPADAIDLWTSHENLIEGNDIHDNFISIFLDKASAYNTIRENVLEGNNQGVIVYHRLDWAPSHSNSIYHNDFFSSSVRHARDFDSNTWDNGAGEGNYWDDYSGVDDNGDGIGDTPYANDLGEVLDHYPLMEPWN